MSILEVLDWSTAPEWANWAARDENDAWYWFEIEPVLDETIEEWLNPIEFPYKQMGRIIASNWQHTKTARTVSIVNGGDIVGEKWMQYFVGEDPCDSGFTDDFRVFSSKEQADEYIANDKSFKKIPGKYISRKVYIQ